MSDLRRLFSHEALNQATYRPAEERAMLELIHLECDGRRHVADHSGPARSAFVERNMRLVLSAARRFVGSGAADTESRLMDLVSAGTIGLIKGIDRFDLSARNGAGAPLRFSTYGMWWIQASIREELNLFDASVVRHRSYREQFRQVRRGLLASSDEFDVDDAAVYAVLRDEHGWPAHKLQRLQTDTGHRVVSLDSVLPQTSDGPLSAALTATTSFDAVAAKERDAALRRAMNALPFVQMYTLMLRYYNDARYEDLARTFDVSVEWVRQTENAALRTLWAALADDPAVGEP